MKEKLRNILFYGGVEEADYNKVLDRIYRSNRVLVNAASGLASALVTSLFLLSTIIKGIGMNHFVYGVGSAISIAILMISLFFSPSRPKLIGALVHLSIVVFYSYGILIGTVTDPMGKTVTFMVMLVFLPMLFTAPPIQILSITVSCEVIFIVRCFMTKNGIVLENDVVDALLFGLLGSISGVIITCTKVKSYVNEYRLEEISRSDKLTGMDNRNAYELDLHSIPKGCQRSLACVYLDVNGLKTINDTEGHKSGDTMLKRVAEIILQYFGEDFAYRVGGDEFIIFIPDVRDHSLATSIDSLRRDIESNGYHAAIGWDNQRLNGLSLTTLQKNAETRMYRDKADYYKSSEHEQRKQ